MFISTLVILFLLILRVHSYQYFNGEVNDQIYRFDEFPASLALHNEIDFKYINLPLISSGGVNTSYSKKQKFSFVPSYYDPECVKAVAENLISGDCELPNYCVGLRMKVIDHRWYGSKVVLCYSYHKHKVDLLFSGVLGTSQQWRKVLKERIVSYTAIINGTYERLKGFDIVQDLDTDRLGYVPELFIRIITEDADIFDTLKPKGDFHAVKYKFYPLQQWKEIYVRLTNNIKFLPWHIKTNEKFVFVCTNNRINFPHLTHNIYEPQNCGDLVPVTPTESYCRDVFINPRTRRCPLDYMPRKTTDTIEKNVFIQNTSGGFISSIVNGLVSGAEKLIEPFARALLTVIESLVTSLGGLLMKLLEAIEPQLEHILTYIVDLIIKFIPIIIKLIKALFSAIIKLLIVINKDIMLLEAILLFTYFSLYYKNTTSLIFSILILTLLFGFERPAWLSALYDNIFEVLPYEEFFEYINDRGSFKEKEKGEEGIEIAELKLQKSPKDLKIHKHLQETLKSITNLLKNYSHTEL